MTDVQYLTQLTQCWGGTQSLTGLTWGSTGLTPSSCLNWLYFHLSRVAQHPRDRVAAQEGSSRGDYPEQDWKSKQEQKSFLLLCALAHKNPSTDKIVNEGRGSSRVLGNYFSAFLSF